jgi:hypothetical protein
MKNTSNLKTLMASMIFVAGTGLAGYAVAGDNPMVGGAEMYPDKTVVENASNAANLTKAG